MGTKILPSLPGLPCYCRDVIVELSQDSGGPEDSDKLRVGKSGLGEGGHQPRLFGSPESWQRRNISGADWCEGTQASTSDKSV